jgi:hypothetical protein
MSMVAFFAHLKLKHKTRPSLNGKSACSSCTCLPNSRSARVCKENIFFETDGILLLVAFLYDTEGATFEHQASNVFNRRRLMDS